MAGTKTFYNADPQRYEGEGWYFHFTPFQSQHGPYRTQREARQAEWDMCSDFVTEREMYEEIRSEQEYESNLHSTRRFEPYEYSG